MDSIDWAWVRAGAVMGFLAVALGAFGAHGLRLRLEGLGTASTYQTAVEYHMAHALALIAVGALSVGLGRTVTALIGWSFLAGIVIFSGSLYVLALTGMKWLGAVTPIGGVAFLVGWAALALYAAPSGRVERPNAVVPVASTTHEAEARP